MPDFQHWNLFPAYFVLAMIGATLSVWAMQLAGNGVLARGEKGCFRWMRRIGNAFVASGLLWSISYGFSQDWQPWAPYLVIVAGLDMSLAMSVLSGYRRQTTNGTQTDPQKLVA